MTGVSAYPMVAPEFNFPRQLRLRNKRHIRALFGADVSTRKSVATGCIRIVYRVITGSAVGDESPIQVGFSAGSRVRLAVERNRVKRRLREVFRLNQHQIRSAVDTSGIGLHMMVIFRGNPRQDASRISQDLPALLAALALRCTSDQGG